MKQKEMEKGRGGGCLWAMAFKEREGTSRGYLLLIETYEQLFLLKKGKAEAALRKKEKNVRQKQSKG